MNYIKPLLKTVQMGWRAKANAGLHTMLPLIAWRVVSLIPLLLVWRNLLLHNPTAGVSAEQMLAYTLAASLLEPMLSVKTVLSGWLFEGQFLTFYQRPSPLFAEVAALTVGGWLPLLLTWSLPVWLLAPLCGISLRPASLWFFPSLLLCISLGFAVDFLFSCLTVRLAGVSWLVNNIRNAIALVLAGSVIPFSLLPWGIGDLLRYQPFASLGGAVLSVLTGIESPAAVLPVQLLWNVLLWPPAILLFRRDQERMVSYGG